MTKYQKKDTKTILIAGGTGLIGRRLREHLVSEGFRVKMLTRNKTSMDGTFIHWNPANKNLDELAISDVDVVINLAGEGIADKRWTPWRRRKIVNSRVFSTNLLVNTLSRMHHNVKLVINASAIGIYGDTGDMVMHEENKSAGDFLGETCARWENAASGFEKSGIRTVIFRLGVVLSMESGMLAEIMKAARLKIMPVFGNGKQYQSWIHIDDLCRMMVKSIHSENMEGIYNAVSPGPLSNRNFMLLLAQIMPGNQFLIRIPKLFLQLFLGDMSKVILHSTRVSSKKIESTGFSFTYPQANNALRNLLGK